MLRRLGIRAKVMAVLAVPMLVLLGAGVYISIDALKEARQVRAAEGVVRTLQAYAPLSGALEAERMVTLNGGTEEQILEARKATDKALRDVRPFTASLDLGEFPESVVFQFKDVQFGYNTQLDNARKLVERTGARTEVERYYRGIITGQVALMDQVANAIPNRELATYITTYRHLAATSDDLVAELIDGLALLHTRVALSTAARQHTDLATATETDRAAARTAVELMKLDGVEMPSKDPSYEFLNYRNYIAQANPEGLKKIDPATYVADVQNQLLALSAVNDKVLSAAEEVASKAADDAQSRAYVTIGLAVLAAALSLFFATVIARGITVPLRRLTAAAAHVRDELPKLVEQVSVPGEGPAMTLEPIPITTRDEVGELAEAFNSVNATTVQVAQEQAALRGSIAEMFVNVARRDQVLLNRQLSFIDSLERAEEDPSTLANLFRLDHLATRMRRNAESLLVLAGIDSGRRLRDAMPLSDVVRTASSEIEQYDRVELDLQTDPHMLGFNALSAAHLLAELLENATIFSEPETPVQVTTGVHGQFVVVRILDHGLGMTDAELTAANEKIRSTGASDALGAQRLGLFVVGRLAQRLGAEVELRKSTRGTGTETIVRFPAGLFVVNETPLYGTHDAPAPAAVAAPAPFEPPVVEEVDLARLTDGQTSLGLPRRRRGDDGAEGTGEQPALPVAPLAESGLPLRPRKTFDEDKIVLPEAPSTNLAADLSGDTLEWQPPTIAAEPLPRGGLPSRTRAASAAWQPEPAQDSAAAPAAPASPTARAGLFSGFRGRGDLPTGTPAGGLAIPSLAPDDEPGATAPAGALPVRGAHSVVPEPVVVPELADDDDAWRPQPAETVADEAPAEPAWSEPAAAEPAWSEPAAAAAEPAWSEPVTEPAEAWAPTFAEPAQAEPEPAEAWAPTFAEPAQDWSAPAEPAAAEAWAPTFAEEPAAAEAWAPTFTEEPAAPRRGSLWDLPVRGEAGHRAAEQAAEPVAAAPVDEPAPVEAPFEPVVAYTETVADVPDAVVEEEPAPAAPEWTSRTSGFTAYSGYSGWAGAGTEAGPSYTAPYVPFERTLDEARAWHTGAIPTVPEPHHALEQTTAAAGTEGWPTPSWETPAPVAYAEPVDVAAPVETPYEPVAAEPEQTSWSQPAESSRADETTTFAPVELEPDEPAWSAPEGQAWPTLEPDPEPAPAPFAQPYEPVAYEAPTRYEEPVRYEQPAPTAYAPTPAPAYEPAQDDAQSTQLFSPVEAAEAVAPQQSFPAPAWAAAPAPEAAAAPAFQELVQPADDDSKPKRRWGLFGKKKSDDTPAPAEHAAPAAFAPVADPEPASPRRTSAWSAEQAAPTAPSWSAPAAPAWSVPAEPAPVAEAPQAGSWAPPEWAAARPAAPAPHAPAAPVATVPQPSLPPSVAPRIGTLDDEVAAMLALRSDIQEQALSELSQLSAYRPSSMGGSNERLTRRVPTAIPAAPPLTANESQPVKRDADELRSRLSSFQSGTSRGRQASTDPAPQNGTAS